MKRNLHAYKVFRKQGWASLYISLKKFIRLFGLFKVQKDVHRILNFKRIFLFYLNFLPNF